jgi:voltage-gated potassium channel
MLRRVGVAVFYGGAVVVTSAIIVNRVEDADSGFETFGDSVWWSIVTITTVGYGDTVPETGVGRVIAAFLMLAGLAILGVLAASLASYFGLEDAEKGDQEASIHDRFDELVSEVKALRAISAADRFLDEPEGPEN